MQLFSDLILIQLSLDVWQDPTELGSNLSTLRCPKCEEGTYDSGNRVLPTNLTQGGWPFIAISTDLFSVIRVSKFNINHTQASTSRWMAYPETADKLFLSMDLLYTQLPTVQVF